MKRRPILTSAVTTLAAAAVLVGGADIASYAATGHALLIGKANSGVGTTSLKNQGRGPALSLNSAKTSPPLTVNSSKLVKNLNAAKVGGLTAAQLNPTYTLYKVGSQGGTLSSDPHFSIVKPPTGDVHWSMTGIWTSSVSADSLECLIYDKRYLTSPSLSYIYAIFDKSSGDPDGNFVQQQGIAHFSKGQRLLIGCEQSGTGTVTVVQPITFSFQGISAKVKHGTPFSPKSPVRPTHLR